MTDGVLLRQGLDGWWAWVAVRIEAATDVTALTEFAALSVRQRLAAAVAAETAWVSLQGDTRHQPTVELRHLNPEGRGRWTSVALGRVHAPDRYTVIASAVELRRRLALLPRHVVAAEETDVSQVAALLNPFTPHIEGIVELRKRLRAAVPQRPDAQVSYYLVVDPFVPAAPDWEPLWRALAEHPAPVLLSVGLQPYHVPAQLSGMLHELTTHFGRLATPSWITGSIWGADRELAPDSFAVDAVQLYADAARRYSGQVFRQRISLASPLPLRDAFVELAASLISPRPAPRDGGPLAEAGEGPAHHAVRPTDPEWAVAVANVTTLDHTRWDVAYDSVLPVVPPTGLRLLAELVDAREATCAVRLPFAVQGQLPGFPVRRPTMPA